MIVVESDDGRYMCWRLGAISLVMGLGIWECWKSDGKERMRKKKRNCGQEFFFF